LRHRNIDFMGYSRSDGRIGTRNYVGIITTVVCAIEVAEAISRKVRETTFFIHQQVWCQTPVDINRVQDTLINLGKNPNLASVLLVSLGCESTVVEEVAKAIGEVGSVLKPSSFKRFGELLGPLLRER
jgi:altronate dehydratase large subunit